MVMLVGRECLPDEALVAVKLNAQNMIFFSALFFSDRQNYIF
jgi:hypothetical protein